MRILVFLPLLLCITSCSSQSQSDSENDPVKEDSVVSISKVEQYYLDNHQDSIPSQTIGSVGRGTLKHGTIIPYSGTGYQYFDTASYLGGRAFTHQKVAKTIVETFDGLYSKNDDRIYRVMEFSNEHGGKMWPHRTHQNGMSVDLMMPLKKNGKPYLGLDDMGATHYLMDFDKEGRYEKDSTVTIDFDQVAEEILYLEEVARKNGLKITKVIFNTNLRDELFGTPNGKKLKESGIYVTRNLEKLINDLHDDHFHVDFELIQ